MEINYLAVIVSAIWAMVLGAIWYGPLFGKQWMKIVGINSKDKKAMAKMKKESGKLYFIQFLIVFFQVFVLAFYIKGWEEASGLENAMWIWAAFIMPTIAGSAMWNNDSKQISKMRFFIQGGYQLVLFISFGLILGMWG
jgi:hypothetical protein